MEHVLQFMGPCCSVSQELSVEKIFCIGRSQACSFGEEQRTAVRRCMARHDGQSQVFFWGEDDVVNKNQLLDRQCQVVVETVRCRDDPVSRPCPCV